MRQSFTIHGRLDGMNDLIAANRKNIYAGAQLKKDNQWKAFLAIKQSGMKPVTGRCRIQYAFYEPNMRRDMDNISGFAHKVIQDALVDAEILENDGWRNISGYTDSFYVDKEDPRIEVTIIWRKGS